MSKSLDTLRTKLESLSSAELRERFQAATGQRPTSPNRVYQIRVILERAAEAKKKPKPARDAAPSSAAASAPRGRFAEFSTTALQGHYESTIGRSTKSTNRDYLIWKIREAEAGRIKIGPRETLDPGEKQVLPLTLSKNAVKAMDRAWKTHSFKSRTAFLRKAICDLLVELNESETAAFFRGPAAQE